MEKENLKTSKPELLVPAGDFECVRAGVQNGADCIYFGANMFSARASAKNFSREELKQVIEYCKIRNYPHRNQSIFFHEIKKIHSVYS